MQKLQSLHRQQGADLFSLSSWNSSLYKPYMGLYLQIKLAQIQALENKALRMIAKTCNHFNPDTPSDDYRDPALDAPCLPSYSPVSSVQILLQLINGCEPITLLLSQRSIALCTCLPADSSLPTTAA
ncbi:hypothetical protein AVEN_147216-1 [Araneus ventricosus]|uniref:Uncharacterized protein n=1 Tax=Araneus ventricosus TaxID=182803 RepID=A0A4Y2X1L4_ARAVE|nr:hypothetical protein AVEN_147216-1 [Araneus ventricosus]